METWWQHPTKKTTLIATILLIWIGLLILFCYRFPMRETLATNGLGDQWFIQTTEAQREWASSEGYVYPDEMDATGERFRWTRGRALIAFSGLGSTAINITFDVTGWPTDTIRPDLAQPIVHVLANGQAVGTFTPIPQRQSYTINIPPVGSDLQIDLRLGNLIDVAPSIELTEYFTSTTRYPNEQRPLGLRLYGVTIASSGGGWIQPNFSIIGWVVLLCLLIWSSTKTWRGGLLGNIFISGASAILVAWLRLWLAPLLTIMSIGIMIWLIWRWRISLLQFWNDWRERFGRSVAWQWSLALVSSAVIVLWLIGRLGSLLETSPQDRLLTANPLVNLMVMLSMLGAIGGLLLIRWRELCIWLERANVRLRSRAIYSLIPLTLILLAWNLYMVSVIRSIPYLGSADYSDNGVVARNLVQGRGWVVDYVTQYYQLNPGGSVTRVQETWPLLQPLLIAPFFKLFGVYAWAAKVPNLLILTTLALLLYHICQQLWDRRIGLVAVIFLILNQHYFRLQLYSTSDLGFALWYVGAIWFGWRAIESNERRWWLTSGCLIGLMCLQKPSGVIIAIGMGLWVIWKLWPRLRTKQTLATIGLWWILPAVLLFSPYMLRNMYEFGSPAYSTESYDAWILEYPGVGDPWEQIYAVMTPEAGLSETGGLPERSWILRWGFQRSYNKVQRQLIATRNYLMPYQAGFGPLAGKGELMGNLDMGAGSDPSRWLMLGSWLAFLGALMLRQRKANLLGFVTGSFSLYLLFLITYWHANEQRYFVPLIPWLCILAASAVWAIHDTIAKVNRGMFRPVALLGVIVLILLSVQPGWVEARNKTSPSGERALWQPDLAAFEWLRQNTPEDAVVMTRVPWQLQFHAERPALMVPYTSNQTTLMRLAQYYNARYLLVNAITNNKGDVRQALGSLLDGREIDGFKRVAAFNGPSGRVVYIYEFSSDYNNVAPIIVSQ